MEHYKEVLSVVREAGIKGLTFDELTEKTSLDKETVFEVVGRMYRLGSATTFKCNDVPIIRARVPQEALYKSTDVYHTPKHYKNARKRHRNNIV